MGIRGDLDLHHAQGGGSKLALTNYPTTWPCCFDLSPPPPPNHLTSQSISKTTTLHCHWVVFIISQQSISSNKIYVMLQSQAQAHSTYNFAKELETCIWGKCIQAYGFVTKLHYSACDYITQLFSITKKSLGKNGFSFHYQKPQ